MTSSYRWKGYAVAAAVCLVTVIAVLSSRESSKQVVTNKQMEEAVHQFVELSLDGIPRGMVESDSNPSISLPERIIEFDLVLPFYSPDGDCRITFSKGRGDEILRSQLSAAVLHGPRTELDANLDLRDVRPGIYYLGILPDGDGAYYYPVRLD